VRSTDHKAPHCVIFSTPLLPRPYILLSTLLSKYPQPTFLPQCERPSSTPIQNNR